MAEKKKSTKKTTTKSAPKADTRARKKSVADDVPPPPTPAPPRHREIFGAVLLVLAVFLIISWFNRDGAFIKFFVDLFGGLLGWGYWLLVPVFLFAAFVLIFHGGRPVQLRVTTALLLPIFVAAAIHAVGRADLGAGLDFKALLDKLYTTGQEVQSGGVIGGLLAIGLNKALSVYGAVPLLLVAIVLCLILAIRGTLAGLLSGTRQAAQDRREARAARAAAYTPAMTELPDPEDELPPVYVAPARKKEQPKKPRRSSFPVDIPLGEEEEELSLKGPTLFEDTEDFPLASEPAAKKTKVRKRSAAAPEVKVEPFDFREEDLLPEEPPAELPKKPAVPVRPAKPAPAPAPAPASVPIPATEIADPPKKKASRQEVDQEAQAMADMISDAGEAVPYEFPPLDLLRSNSGTAVDARDEIQMNKERLEGALHSFGINAGIVGVTHGPTVTRYDIELEQGVKLSRVTNLAGDLALALGVINVRIAPIPDKISTVGIEVPNKIVSTVYLRDIIGSAKFQSAKSKISFALGKDIGGDCIVGNIAKLPHMLIAGTTGSGKSVCMNSLILSLLYKARPDEVRLIMIDPKMVELGVYNGIPHLYVPVVTDPKKAAGALQWSVVEMLKRYRLFSEMGVRDLENYNRHALAAGEQTLPQVVIVIDELADLMLVASKEVEESICRVAQMGRAAGMHLVIATQRPSADVITGLMKANIPSRIAFAVSSTLESRIILDQGGAEKLVGMGDMLYSPVGSGKPTRIQGAFVSDEEREEVIQFIKDSAGEIKPNDDILAAMEKASEDKGTADSGKGGKDSKDEGASASGYDEMLPQAVEVVLETGSCSVSMLQRRIKLGYSRAARIVDQMEELGVVGPYEGAKPRSVVIDRAGWQELQVQLGLASDADMTLAAEMSEAADQL